MTLRTPELPASIVEAAEELEVQIRSLAAALPTRVKAGSTLREADRVEDNAVGALVALLEAWRRLPREEHPREVGIAERSLEVVLEGGTLVFLTYRPIVEHSEVQRRIDNLQAEGLDRELRTLGAGPFLDHLLAAHTAYGEACGITRAVVRDDTPPSARSPPSSRSRSARTSCASSPACRARSRRPPPAPTSSSARSASG